MSGGSARIRQRKVSLKNSIRIVFEKDLNDVSHLDYAKDPLEIETGVEKHEEKEFHLQEILNQNALNAKKHYIPTPKATTHWPKFDKYYQPQPLESKTYIRQSATVEDCSGCPYNMDEQDDAFLSKINKGSDVKCSEDEFEMIMYLFDTTVREKQPFLSTDATQLLDYTELEAAVLAKLTAIERDPQSLDRLLNQLTNSVFTPKMKPSPDRTPAESIKRFGPRIYTHYRTRKISVDGGDLTPQLKFETNTQKDDFDPYVCFRRRETRQTRKTRRTDQQSSERLRRLQAEMRQAKLLFEMVAKREQLRLQSIQLDLDVFEQQCVVKAAKRKAKVAGDDEDLLTALVKRREEPRRLPVKRAPEPKHEKVEKVDIAKVEKVEKKAQPKVPSSRIPDLDHVTLEQMLAEREESVQNMVRQKIRARATADHGWVNKTADPFVPWVDSLDASDNTSLDDLYSSLNSLYPPPAKRICLPLSHSLGRDVSKKFVAPKVIWASDSEKEGAIIRREVKDADIAPNDNISVPRNSSIGMRRRIGRSGMQFIDRRSVVRPVEQDLSNPESQRWADRFKFDSDMQSESPADIYSEPARLNGVLPATQQIRFGAMLLAKSYEHLHEAQQQRQLRLKRKSTDIAASAASAARVAQAAHAAQNPPGQLSQGQASQASASSSAGQVNGNQSNSSGQVNGTNAAGQAQGEQKNKNTQDTPGGRQSYPISVVSF